MIVTLPPYLVLDDFARHHGWDGVCAYLDMARRGLDIELELARELLPRPIGQVKQLGSMMVCDVDDDSICKLRVEYEHLRRLGRVRCEWRDGNDVARVMHGRVRGGGGSRRGGGGGDDDGGDGEFRAKNFGAGIWFPDDARIDSTAYARALLNAAANIGRRRGVGGGGEDGEKFDDDDHHDDDDAPAAVTIVENCSPMTSVATIAAGGGFDDDIDCNLINRRHDSTHHAEVRLANGRILQARHVIVATGGMHVDEHLAGLLTPRYSYLVALPHRPITPRFDHGCRYGCDGNDVTGNDDGGKSMMDMRGDSPNFFTLGFSHDWCVESNFVRISGEDHYSGLKRPRSALRCHNLATWGYDKYPYLDANVPYLQRHGVYSETSDYLPLVGTPYSSSRVCYMVGCNAWGQASLSALASSAPALLGYRDFHPDEIDFIRLCSIGRFVGRYVSESARRKDASSRHRRTMDVDSSPSWSLGTVRPEATRSRL
ncbi:hypothetical protein ACHAXA_009173 [Cyclostephanos tholiformis]|uniref:FAD dependent oxidoreductase domain-containing protein n=1 Tax=Cyclostephanos tholiformis TaxID=382380 RepID=A0ABD3RRB4_9STRA